MKKKMLYIFLIVLTVIFILIANKQRGHFAVGGEIMPLLFIPIVKTW